MARQAFGTNTTIKLLYGQLRVNVPGKVIRRAFTRNQEVMENVGDLRPLFDAFGDYMLERIDKRFRYEGLPKRWAPLAPATLRDKARQGYAGRGILQRTGRLRRGFRAVSTPRTLQIINRRSVRGVNLYQVHQHGTRTIPARRMVDFGDVERKALRRFTARYVWGTE